MQQLPVSDHRYAAFKHALRVRNRITHPKSVVDTVVSREEIQAVLGAAAWYSDIQKAILARWEQLIDQTANAD